MCGWMGWCLLSNGWVEDYRLKEAIFSVTDLGLQVHVCFVYVFGGIGHHALDKFNFFFFFWVNPNGNLCNLNYWCLQIFKMFVSHSGFDWKIGGGYDVLLDPPFRGLSIPGALSFSYLFKVFIVGVCEVLIVGICVSVLLKCTFFVCMNSP